MVRAGLRLADTSVRGRPIQIATDAYVSSDACRACHPSEYASWRASYHRTMTQVATPEAVRASFNRTVVTDVPGNPIQLERRGGEFWATLTDPDSPGGVGRPAPSVARQIVMTTGSHSAQAYWYRTGRRPFGDERDDGVRGRAVELGAVGVAQTLHVTAVFDDRHLHA